MHEDHAQIRQYRVRCPMHNICSRYEIENDTTSGISDLNQALKKVAINQDALALGLNLLPAKGNYSISGCNTCQGARMDRNAIEAFVQEIMLDFPRQTGLMSNDAHPRRYLWTDAFAVCNYIELFRRTRDETWNCEINMVMLATSLAPNGFLRI